MRGQKMSRRMDFKKLDQREGIEEKTLLEGDGGVITIQAIA